MFEALGLSVNARRLYREMLGSVDLGVAELSVGLALPEAQVRSALDELTGLELLRASRDRLGAWRAVSPEHGLQVLILREAADLEDRRTRLASMQSAVSEIVGDYLRPRSVGQDQAVGTLETLTGLDAIQERMEAIAHGARFRCRSVVPGGPVSAEALKASRPLDMELLDRGVEQQILYQESARSDPATVAYGFWMVMHGAQVRTAAVLPLRMLIVDENAALIPVNSGGPSQGAVLIANTGVIEYLIAVFDVLWSMAVPLQDEFTRDDLTGLLPGERELIRLLAQGMTDVTAAKHLGVSLRTVRRRMAELMERLDSGSRFAAGIEAARRGWV